MRHDYVIDQIVVDLLAAALQAGAATVYTEDLQHHQLLRGSLRIVNPFLDTAHAL